MRRLLRDGERSRSTPSVGDRGRAHRLPGRLVAKRGDRSLGCELPRTRQRLLSFSDDLAVALVEAVRLVACDLEQRLVREAVDVGPASDPEVVALASAKEALLGHQQGHLV